jgi:hypothetical protein
MTTWPDVPDFGGLLRPHLDKVPVSALPTFLAALERSAAARYRSWASEAPEYSDELSACAEREDEIAALVTELFPLSDEDEAAVAQALPDAVAVYYETFDRFTFAEQLYVQSEAELQGAGAWNGIAAQTDDAEATEILARCAALEEESSRAVKRLLPTLTTGEGASAGEQ